MDWYQIATLALPLVSIILGYFIRKYYKVSSNVKSILKESVDIVFAVEDAMKDNKIDAEEIKKLVKEVKDLYYVVHGITLEEDYLENGNK